MARRWASPAGSRLVASHVVSGARPAFAASGLSATVQMVHPVKGARLFAEVERSHPKEPHWYLSLLVVDPDWQRRGFGSRLIRPGLAAADEEGLPCYLETQKEANLAWYARFGFELDAHHRAGRHPAGVVPTRPAT